MTEYPALALLTKAYFSYDWPEDYDGDPWGAVEDFARSEPDLAPALTIEVEQILVRKPSEADLRRLVLDELRCGYVAEADGWTYRDWLVEVARRVEGYLRTPG